MQASFSLATARTIVIACVSPASKDTEHSLNTLRHACMMHGQQDGDQGASASHQAIANISSHVCMCVCMCEQAPAETRFVVGGTVKTVQVRPSPDPSAVMCVYVCI